MPDKRFFPAPTPISASDIVSLVGGELVAGEGETLATDVAPLEAVGAGAGAGAGAVCFIAHKKYIPQLKSGGEGCIILTTPDLAPMISNGGAVVITVADPKQALGQVLQVMLGAEPPDAQHGINPSAVIDASVRIGEGVSIGAGAVIEADVEIGDNAVIGANVFIGRGCVVADKTSIGANTVISHSLIGAGTQIGPLSKIGGAGFGIMQGHGEGQRPFPHLGRVIIGKNCYIAGHCSIDRGFLGDTIIGDCVMMDSMVHIAHNVFIGAGCVLCAFTGISGSCRIGANNTFAAAAAVIDNITIGDGNVFMARAGVTKDIGDNTVWGGAPAVPASQFRRQIAQMLRLGKGKSNER